MKALKKYEYMSPETEILPLEMERVILDDSLVEGPENYTGGDPGNASGYGAPWRF